MRSVSNGCEATVGVVVDDTERQTGRRQKRCIAGDHGAAAAASDLVAALNRPCRNPKGHNLLVDEPWRKAVRPSHLKEGDLQMLAQENFGESLARV